jgi:hypothetical protein
VGCASCVHTQQQAWATNNGCCQPWLLCVACAVCHGQRCFTNLCEEACARESPVAAMRVVLGQEVSHHAVGNQVPNIVCAVRDRLAERDACARGGRASSRGRAKQQSSGPAAHDAAGCSKCVPTCLATTHLQLCLSACPRTQGRHCCLGGLRGACGEQGARGC